MLTFLFPGQGSQTLGMGKELFAEFPAYVKQAETILGFSILSLCQDDISGQLNQTQYTQPALFIVNAMSYWVAKRKAKPDYVAGHSLGEYNALLAANVFDFETGVRLVKKRGELMAKANNGGMAAVLGMERETLQILLAKEGLHALTLANHNSYLQCVISGNKQDIEKATTLLTEIPQVSCLPLKVSGAFHSHYMQTAQQEFENFLADFTFNVPTLPVIANINATPYHPASIKTNLANQITHSVEWTQTMEYFFLQDANMQFKEIGPGQVLSGLLNRIKRRQ